MMSTRTFAAAAALALTAGAADAQVIYGGGYGPGFYSGGYTAPSVLSQGGYTAPGFFNNTTYNRGVINAGSSFTPIYTSGYSPYLTSPSFYGLGYSPGTFSTGYPTFGSGYTGIYNAGVLTPGYVGGYRGFSPGVLPRAGVYGGGRLRR